MNGGEQGSSRADAADTDPAHDSWTDRPWWVWAVLGSSLIAILSVPQLLRSGAATWEHYPWYWTADHQLRTGLILDQAQYMRIAEAAAGRAWEGAVVAPFSRRAFAPVLASFTGLDPELGIWVVNVLSLTAGTFALAALAMAYTRRRLGVVVAVAVWSVAFPVAWYTGKGFVDPAAVGLVPVVLWGALRQHRVVGWCALVAAMWTKEAAALVLVPVLVAELLRHDASMARRLARCAGWVAVAVLAVATAGIFVEGADITFAPWIPPSFDTVRRMLVFNLSRRGGFTQYLLAAAPALLAAALWLPGWSRRDREDRDAALPLLLGCAAALALGAWSLVSALFDGRTAWLSIPFAGLLLGRWAASTEPAARRTDLRRLVRRGLVVVPLVLVAWVVTGVVVNSIWAQPAQAAAATEARIAVPGTSEEHVDWRRLSGDGPASIERGEGSRAWLVAFESEEPAQVVPGGDLPALPSTPTRSGTVAVIDPAVDTVRLETSGPWRAQVLDIDAAMPWELLSPLRGSGPAVLLVPHGAVRSFEIATDFDDADGRMWRSADCDGRPCLTPASGGSIPAGTEVIVVDAEGDWQLVPR